MESLETRQVRLQTLKRYLYNQLFEEVGGGTEEWQIKQSIHNRLVACGVIGEDGLPTDRVSDYLINVLETDIQA